MIIEGLQINLILYLLALSGGFLAAVLLTPLAVKIAEKFGVMDDPNGSARKIHHRKTPLLGGLAIFLAVFIVIFVFRFFQLADFSLIPDSRLWAIFFAGALIMIGGFLDDKFNLKPWQQIIWPVLAAALAVFGGVKIGYVSNLFGGPNNALIYLVPFIGAILSFVWLLVMMYTTKFLDGIDGLVASISSIAALVIFFLSLDWDVSRSATGFWALILAGAALGFLVFNWHPAKIFLGEGGSIFLGFMLGVLSIISGSKIATTLLVVGLPIFDVFWVIAERLWRRESPFSHADKKHLHFRLLEVGLSERGAVLFFCFAALVFGAVSVFAQSFGKVVALLILVACAFALFIALYFVRSKKAAVGGLTREEN